MGKLILLLLIGGSLALFAVSNLTPISLVILGVRTLALPLAVWVLGALLAGAVTTVLLSGFSSISKGAAVRRANQVPRDARSPWTTARSDKSSAPPGTAGFSAATDRTPDRTPDRTTDRATDRATDRTSRSADRQEAWPDDDWDRDREAWDSWNEPGPARTTRSDVARTESRTSDKRADWQEYEDRVRSSNRRDPDASTNRTPINRAPDNRTPENRTPNNRVPDNRAGAGNPRSQPEPRKGDVYDAEYRVLIPPYSQPANPVPPPPAPTPAPSDEEDWGLDDEPQDRPR